MALHKQRRRISKNQLALAVRKDFNAAMASEPETITSFLYTVQNQGMNGLGRQFCGLGAYYLQIRTFACDLLLG